MSNLTLFKEIPVNSKFRFETPDTGKIFIKTDEKSAHHDGAFYPVNPGVLVFLVPNPILIADFTQADGTHRQALEVGNKWALIGNPDDLYFNTLEDIINHLGV